MAQEYKSLESDLRVLKLKIPSPALQTEHSHWTQNLKVVELQKGFARVLMLSNAIIASVQPILTVVQYGSGLDGNIWD